MAHSTSFIEAKAFEVLSAAGPNALIGRKVDVDQVCISLNVRLHVEELESEVSGVLLVKGAERHILVNKSHNQRRQRFTIGHELGHLMLHDMSKDRVIVDTHIRMYQRVGEATSSKYQQSDSMTSPQEEREANTFAAALLMPKPWVESEALKRDLGDETAITTLANAFVVSEQAMFIRLQQLKIIESTYATNDPGNMRGRQQRLELA